jgi:hypothetical protein
VKPRALAVGHADYPDAPHDRDARSGVGSDPGIGGPEPSWEAPHDDPGVGGAEQNFEAPYGDLCETRPRRERQTWNTRKKVISFSLFMPLEERGHTIRSHWLDGIEANVRLASLYYPEWIVRVYVLNLSEKQVKKVIAINDKSLEVVVCPEGSALTLPVHGSMSKYRQYRSASARYLAMDDPKVEYAIFRDLDSRPSIRELFAVNEWISSGMEVHTMHDHRQHHVPLMGGMWGAKRGAVNMTSELRRAFLVHPNVSIASQHGGDDQGFLADYIWPAVKDSAIDHEIDSQRCRGRGSKVCRKFPMRGDGRDSSMFIGQKFTGQFKARRGSSSHFDCSVACTPSGRDWFTDLSTSNL